MTTHEKLLQILEKNNIPYRLVTHPAEGRSEEIAKIRGNDPHQALKAIVLLAKYSKKDVHFHMAVVPGDRRINLSALQEYLGARKVIFAPTEKAREVTGCEIGAIPPFVFVPGMKLLADPGIKDSEEVVFNAGLLTKSIFMPAADYLRVADPEWVAIAAAADEND